MLNTNNLPNSSDLSSITRLVSSDQVFSLLEPTLFEPLRDAIGRPSKKIRAQILELGYRLSDSLEQKKQDPLLLSKAANLLEHLHAASLIIDDIQDESLERRGAPSLHRIYGTAIALNAGNWLYFWCLSKLAELGIELDCEQKIFKMCLDMYLRAHAGQALDVGSDFRSIQRENVASVCLATAELKTGALMSFGFCLGAEIGNVSQERFLALEQFGLRFGVALQMFDDIGPGIESGFTKKHREDFLQFRPTWLWATVANEYSESEFEEFRGLALGPEDLMVDWAKSKSLTKVARLGAKAYMDKAFDEFMNSFKGNERTNAAFSDLRILGETLARAYEKL